MTDGAPTCGVQAVALGADEGDQLVLVQQQAKHQLLPPVSGKRYVFGRAIKSESKHNQTPSKRTAHIENNILSPLSVRTFGLQDCSTPETVARAAGCIGRQRTALRKKDGLVSIITIRLSINFSVPELPINN